jgi:O-antigen ligase
MFALQCTAALQRTAYVVLGAPCAYVLLRSGLSPETVAFVAACIIMLMMGRMAAAGATRPGFVCIIASAWLAAAIISTAIALIQYFGWAAGAAPWVHVTAAGDAVANLRQRNQFASLTAIGMASLFWLFPGNLRKPVAVVAIAWLAVGNAATTSRTGLAEMLLLGILAVLWNGLRRERAFLALTALGVYLMATLVLPWLLEASTGEVGHRLWDRVAESAPCSSRSVLWSNVLSLIARKPWNGWGWGELDYAHFSMLYDGPRFCDILDNAHNLPLHLAVELGLPAALLLCGAVSWAVLRAKPWNEADRARQLAWAVVAIIALHSLLEYPLWYGPFQMAAGLCVGLLWRERHPAAAVTAGMSPAAARMLGICAIAACAYAFWDYRRAGQIYLQPEARLPALREDPLGQARSSWLFGNQVRFAELTITPLTGGNAAWTFEQARSLLHFSPEPRVIEKLIESQTVLARDDELLLNLARFRAAFPEAYQQWSQARSGRGAATPGNQPAL